MTRTARGEELGVIQAVAAEARILAGTAASDDALMSLIGDARFVLIGEASHGTHEFYVERAELTKRLIAERGFAAVCIEGDWPDAYRVNRYVQGEGDDRDAAEALEGFMRFPTWMWRNEVVRDFVAWLREHNGAHRASRAGFFGLDLYSLFGSIHAILDYLEGVDPEAARRARERSACFEHFAQDSHAYGYATAARMADSCEEDAVRQMVELRSRGLHYISRDGLRAADEFFSAEQNARLVRNAEHYYRSMYRGRISSWNLRDRHMAETLEAVERHLVSTRREPRIVVWAHNSHLGDARFTDMRRRGEVNLGQLARERWGRQDVRLIGFSTNTGTVTAAHDWDEPGHRMRVRPAMEGSYEQVFGEAAKTRRAARLWLPLRDPGDAARALTRPRLQRAIGVIYRPETERASHYYAVELPNEFDAIIHLDHTTALRGLEPGEHWEHGVQEPPETFPSGM